MNAPPILPPLIASPCPQVPDLVEAVRRDGFGRAAGPQPEPGFLAGWDDLSDDPYWEPVWGRRQRRHAAFEWDPTDGWPEHRPGAAHLQAPRHNRLYGGVERLLPPLDPALLRTEDWKPWVEHWRATLVALDGPGRRYAMELHAFRVAPGPDGTPGRPTPEGLHRDGHDWVAVHLVAREHLDGGRLTVVDDARGVQQRLDLTPAPQTVWLDDRRVRHVAEPVVVHGDPGRARRDTLVATFRRLEG